MTPFCDPAKSYEENYKSGPFGAFVDGEISYQEGQLKFQFFRRDEEGEQKDLRRSRTAVKVFLQSLTKSQQKKWNCSRNEF